MGLVRNTYLLKGVTIEDFNKSIEIGDFFEADNGSGHLIEIGIDYLKVQWFSGRFTKGDILFCKKKNSQSTKRIKEVVFETQPFNALSFNINNGYMGVGLPNGNALQPLTVGGKIGIQSSRTHGQYIPEETKKPALVIVNSFEIANPKGVQVELTTNRAEEPRLVLTDYEGKKETANIGAVTLHVSFIGETNTPEVSAFNTKEIQSDEIGSYWIYFKNPVNQLDYQVTLTLGTGHPLEYAYCDKKESERFRVKVVKTGTITPVAPTTRVSVICVGGF